MAEHWAEYLRWLRETYCEKQGEYISTDITEPTKGKPDRAGEGALANCPEEGEISPALDALRKYREGNVILVGNPGLGKTTTVRRFMLEQAVRAENRSAAEIPILVEPKYHSSSKSIMGLIVSFLNRSGNDFSEKMVRKALSAGRLLLLFDGLNEIPSDDALRDLSCFLDEFSEYTPMVFTSRDVGTTGAKGIKIRLVMKGLSVAQREKFVRKSLGAEADKMLLALQKLSPTLGETPLLLKTLCHVFRKRGRLPHNLGLIFREWIADYTAQELRGTEEDRRMWPKLTSYLAFAMTEGDSALYARLSVSKERAVQILTDFLEDKKWGNPGDQAERFLDQLLKCYLLQITGESAVEFPHQLLQDYFAAEYLLNVLPERSDEDVRSNWLNYVKWTEPICMTMELAREDVTQLRLLELALGVDLVFAARLAGASMSSSKSIEVLMSQDIPLKLKVDLLGRSRSEAALPELERALKERNPIIREIAALAMGKSGILAASEPLAHALLDKYPSVPWSAAEALRQIDATPAEESLIEILKVGDKRGRWAAAKALGGLRSYRARQALIKSLGDPEGNVRHMASESLGVMSAEEAIVPLTEHLGDPDWHVAGGAAEALGRIGSRGSEKALLKGLFHDHSYVRKAAAKALNRLGSDKAWSILVDRLTALDPFLRRCAAEGLENLHGEETIGPLIEALTDDESSVKWTAARALGEKRAKDSLPHLVNLFSDPDPGVVLAAVRSLGQVGRLEALEPVEELQRNSTPDSERYFICLTTLARVGSSSAIAELLAIVTQENHSNKVRAALVLGELQCAEATEALFDLLIHESQLIRLRAADKLAGMADHSLIERLWELFDKTQDLLLIDLMSWIQQRWGFYNARLLPWERDFHLLHLSDLHFGNKYDATIWFSALLLDIEEDLQPPRIDAIVISGDVVYGPQEEDGFGPAVGFLNDIMALYGVEANRVVVVPGNHDVDLDSNPTGIFNRFISIFRWSQNGSKDKFRRFRDFYHQVKSEEYAVEYDRQVTLDEFADQRAVIMGLNSAWEIDAGHKKRASIHPVALANGIRRVIPQYKEQEWLKIAVWHHPLMSDWDDFIKNHDFMKSLAKAGFRIALHGHAHFDSYDDGRWTSEGFGSIAVIGAGSFGVPPEGLIPAIPWQYNFLSIRGKRVTIRVRRKESKAGPWQGHKDWEFEI